MRLEIKLSLVLILAVLAGAVYLLPKQPAVEVSAEVGKILDLPAEILEESAPKTPDPPFVPDARTKTSGCSVNGPYPEHKCTPGAIFVSTTVEQICTQGYTKTVRNVSVTLKKQVYAAYGVSYPQPTGSYEADHFIPLAIGGNNDIANLFPEAEAPARGELGFREKDLVEVFLQEEVCAGRMSLPRAQEAIVDDWVAVYKSMTPAQLADLKSRRYW